MSFIEYIGSIGGIAGILAVLMFSLMKYLVKQMREDRKFMEDRMASLLNDYNKAVQDNTKISSELYTWLKAKNGNKT